MSKKILMISDYTTVIGGIEQFIIDARTVLQEQGVQVRVFGLALSSKILRVIRPLGLLCTAFNMRGAIKAVYLVQSFNPDIVWLHSVSRFLGRLPLCILGKSGTTLWMMYHDLGLFHPYPSKVEQVEQIPPTRSLGAWYKAGAAVGQTLPHHYILMLAKFISASLIRIYARKYITYHLVPSAFMVPIVQNRGMPQDRIKVLSHFGRIEEYINK